uniref:acyclic terpene utilization AtuA family protein n=1 Tax=Advenella kashmirensis TaxID=310575 RepID=UPI00269E868C|nr:acyclic terpene utilization AtuA family protein [Advenella kashmirensis]
MNRGITLVSNAGGLNPEKCKEMILSLAKEQGLSPKIAVVTGDDVSNLKSDFKPFDSHGQARDSVTEDTLNSVLSANAYLGAVAIVEALKSNPDIVVVGRCVDSALLVAIAAHEFGWSFSDYDRLAQASLAGHLIECGPQTTGGLFTDWETVPDWSNIGYPIVAMNERGDFQLSKAPDTGGLITPATVAEQLLYEIGDPSAYLLPDVICDFRNVKIEQIEPDKVTVTGAKGERRPMTTKSP